MEEISPLHIPTGSKHSRWCRAGAEWHHVHALQRWSAASYFQSCLCGVGNRSLGSNSIGRKGKFRLWPCHMNCYLVVKLFRSWVVLIAMPRRASASISHGSWPALPCRQLWLQLPWPMCRRTVSVWIIYGLCSSLTQEHWRQQWIMFTLIPPINHL